LSNIVKGKLINDLEDFKQQYEGCPDFGLVAPQNPEIFASGSIINCFTPNNKRETEILF
jgi:hypothetical protein